MTEFERKILDKSKEKDLVLDGSDIKAIREADMDEADKAGLLAVCSVRANLKDKSKEPQALWRFIRYLTEIEMPLQIIDFTGLLFPGNDTYFSKILTPTAFKMIQQQATLMVENEKYENEEHKEWLERIAEGHLPYGYSININKEENEDEDR